MKQSSVLPKSQSDFLPKPGFDFCTTLPDWAQLRSHIFGQISRAFDGQEHLLPVSEIELIGSFMQGLSMIVRWENQPIAHTRLFKLTEYDFSEWGEWYELGSTWVHPDFWGKKLCTRMYEKFLPLHADKNILSTTTNDAMLRVGEKHGFVTIPRQSLPINVWKSSCSCSFKKTGATNNVFCRLASGETQQRSTEPCSFQVTRDTAIRIGIL